MRFMVYLIMGNVGFRQGAAAPRTHQKEPLNPQALPGNPKTYGFRGSTLVTTYYFVGFGVTGKP